MASVQTATLESDARHKMVAQAVSSLEVMVVRLAVERPAMVGPGCCLAVAMAAADRVDKTAAAVRAAPCTAV